MGPGESAPAGGTKGSRVPAGISLGNSAGDPAGGPEGRGWRRFGPPGLLAGGVLIALAVRWPLLPYETGDFLGYLRVWYGFIVANGHFDALQYGFYDYNPPYLYLLTTIASTAPGLSALLAIKFVSLAFEAPLAFLAHRIVRRRRPRSRTIPVLAALAVLFAPTVVLNGAFWAQCDAIYTTFLMACFFFLLKERPGASFASFGLAVAFKAQALFFLPALFWIAATRNSGRSSGRNSGGSPEGSPGASVPADGAAIGGFPLRAILMAPLAYFLALLPAWFLGRPAYDLLLVYLGQAGKHGDLAKNVPNLWQWVPNEWYALWPLGVLATVAVVWGVTLAVRRSRALPTADLLVTLSAFALILTPYLLPKMHDRYFFPAEVFAVLLAFHRPRFWWVPIALGLTSVNGYLHYGFGTEAPFVPLAGAAVVPLLILVLLGRQLLRDLGYSFRPERLVPRVRREFARRKAAAAPLALLLLTLGGMFLSAWAGGRLVRPVGDDPVAAGTLARAANLNAEHYFVRFSHRTLEPDGAVAYHRDGGGAPGGDFALRFVTGHFPRDHTARLTAARMLMALFFFGAALLAYLSLARLLERRSLALAAVLLVFSWFWAGSGLVVAAAGPPALFGVFLAFHGLVVFAQEGRLRPALVACGAGVLFSFAALALILMFVSASVLLSARESRRRRSGEAKGAALPPGFRRRFDRRLPALAGFGLAVVLATWGLDALNTRALLAGEGVRDGASVAGSSLFADAPATGSAGSARSAPGSGPGFPGSLFSGLGSGFVPGGGTDSAGGGAAPAIGVLLLLAGVVGAAWSRWRVPFLSLSLSGFAAATAATAAAPEVGGLAALGPVLVVVALGFAPLRRFRGPGPVRIAAGAAVGIALLLGHRGAEARPEPEPAAREARVRQDFDRIRGALRGRGAGAAVFVPGDAFRSLLAFRDESRSRAEAAVFVPRDPFRGGGFAGGRATAWYLAGFVLAGGERRADAEYLLGGEPGPGPGRLTPGNREVFLHDRAVSDGELGAWIEAAGPPRLSSEFEVYLAGDRLLYVREHCAPENLEGTFRLRLRPRDEADLPPLRRSYGFEDLRFRFEDRALDTVSSCVAGVRLPEYDLRTIATGRFLRDDEGRLTPVWRGEFDPSARPGGAG